MVDNASVDKTWDICQKYQNRDRRVRVFKNKTNIGPVLNWMKCAEYAEGEYVKILFSDDVLMPNCLEAMVPFLNNAQVGLVFSSVLIRSSEGERTSYRWKKRSGVFNAREFIRESLISIGEPKTPVSPCAAMFRRHDFISNLLYQIPTSTANDFSRHGAGPDLLLFLLTLNNYEKVAFVNRPLMLFRSHYGSITISKRRIVEERYICSKMWYAESYLGLFGKLLLFMEWLKWMRRNARLVRYNHFYRKFFKVKKN